MPRVSVTVWMKRIMSKDGPHERLRHVAHVLRSHIRDDGAEGCHPSQRRVGELMGIDHKTAAKALRRLCEQGWAQVEEVARQFGRKGHRYFPAVPDRIGETLESPIGIGNGDTQVPQSAIGESVGKPIGESRPAIGESPLGIGDTQVPRKSLTEAIAEGAASPSPVATGSSAPTESEEGRLARLHLVATQGGRRRKAAADAIASRKQANK